LSFALRQRSGRPEHQSRDDVAQDAPSSRRVVNRILPPVLRVLCGGNERGTALLETALTLPLILLVSVSIFEFGRAYQMEQVLTNAAREGARVAVLPGSTSSDVQSRVVSYLNSGQVPNASTASVIFTPNVAISI